MHCRLLDWRVRPSITCLELAFLTSLTPNALHTIFSVSAHSSLRAWPSYTRLLLDLYHAVHTSMAWWGLLTLTTFLFLFHLFNGNSNMSLSCNTTFWRGQGLLQQWSITPLSPLKRFSIWPLKLSCCVLTFLPFCLLLPKCLLLTNRETMIDFSLTLF